MTMLLVYITLLYSPHKCIQMFLYNLNLIGFKIRVIDIFYIRFLLQLLIKYVLLINAKFTSTFFNVIVFIKLHIIVLLKKIIIGVIIFWMARNLKVIIFIIRVYCLKITIEWFSLWLLEDLRFLILRLMQV